MNALLKAIADWYSRMVNQPESPREEAMHNGPIGGFRAREAPDPAGRYDAYLKWLKESKAATKPDTGSANIPAGGSITRTPGGGYNVFKGNHAWATNYLPRGYREPMTPQQQQAFYQTARRVMFPFGPPRGM